MSARRAGVAPTSLVAALSVLAGALGAQALGELPPRALAIALLAVAIALAWIPRLRVPALVLAGFAWAVIRGGLALDVRIPHAYEGVDLRIEGRVVDLPQRAGEAMRFEVAVQSLEPVEKAMVGSGAAHPTIEAGVGWAALLPTSEPYRARGRVRLSSYHGKRTVAPGDVVTAIVRLKRPRGAQNPGGFDFERFALERRIAATGYVREWRPIARAKRPGVDALRQRASAWIARGTGDPEVASLLRALAVGDQAAIADEDWDVLRATGTTHLIAISGFHVGLAAGLGALLARAGFACWPRIGLRVPRRQLEAAAALGWACAYAALAGFSLPVQRTLLMIAVILLAVLLRRALRATAGLGLALLVLLAADPLAVLAAGFWLSFVGVAWLVLCLDGRAPRGAVLASFGRAQLAMAFGLLPLGVWFFQQGSIVGPFANLFAIPWLSFVVVPVLLLALLAHALVPVAGDVLLAFAAALLERCWWALEQLAALPYAEMHLPEPALGPVALALIGAAVLMLPRAAGAHGLGALLFLPLLFPRLDTPRSGELELTAIDVGQGLALLVRTRSQVLVYDAGAAFPGGFDHGDAAVVPALRALGVRRIDVLVVSHGDNDHAGGAPSVIRAMKPRRILRAPGLPFGEPCIAGDQWTVDGVDFELLHPPAGYPDLGNDSSCVLRASAGGRSVLLTGDISSAIERRLVAERAPLAADVLVLPHHGSRSSSSAAFIAAVRPALAIASAGHRNRYGHPAKDVRARLAAAHVPLHTTALDGALRVRLGDDGVIGPDARRAHAWRYWRER